MFSLNHCVLGAYNFVFDLQRESSLRRDLELTLLDNVEFVSTMGMPATNPHTFCTVR